MHCIQRSAQHGTKQGFALIVALSLMAFILVLLVTMAILARVESESSSTVLENLRVSGEVIVPR